MLHLTNTVFLLSFTLVIVSLIGGGYLYVQYKNKLLIYLLLFLASLGLLLLTVGIDWYQTVFNINESLFVLPKKIIDYTALILCVYSFPVLIHSLLGIERTLFHKFTSNVIIVFSILLGITRLFFPIRDFAKVSFSVILFGTAIYCLITGFRYRNELGNKFLRSTLFKFLLITALFVPYLIGDLWFNPSPYNLSQPLYLLSLNILGIIFSFKYLKQRRLTKCQEVADNFRNTFELSSREMEIISLVLKGNTNQVVANTLFISIKTVESHMSRIFRKTGVSNRIQLVYKVFTKK